MKLAKILLSATICMTMFAACGPNRDKSVAEIEAANSQLLENANVMGIDPVAAQNVIGLYMKFAEDFPKDSLTPIYLFKAGDMASNLALFDTAILCYDRVINDYAETDVVCEALLMKGFTFEQQQKFDDARAAYNAFLEHCPDHPLAKDIKHQMDNHMIGMSPEEMLEFVQENPMEEE